MKNESGLKPLGRAVLVKHWQPERKQSLIVIPDNVKQASLMLEQRATVIALGEAVWPDEPHRAQLGDRVLISRMAGYLAKGDDGETYCLVNDRDIFCGLTGDQNG